MDAGESVEVVAEKSGARWLPMFENYWGNEHVVRTLEGMLECGRIPQTILLFAAGGIGKATLARRFGQALLDQSRI